jgi:UDP-N-acetylglucosamine/UDP-N-acetylgalactosamine diphosphorylase
MTTELTAKLAAAGQNHLLVFLPSLSESSRHKLLRQLESLDFAYLARLAAEYVTSKPKVLLPADIKPPHVLPRHPHPHPHRPDQVELYRKAESRGLELLRAGQVAAFLVAGGQGTRLGYDGPKGEYPVTPIRNKPLFQTFAEQLLARSKISGRSIPWYVMTSDVNDAPTRAYFAKHNHFGYPPADVVFFQQGMIPAFSMDGKLLLAEKDSLALSPDGHGGSLTALKRSGALADMQRRGITHISYFQVDNPLVQTIDPLFLGLHDLTSSEMSSKTIPKAHALEKVGNFCIGDGKLQVIEYSDLPESLARTTNPDGSLMFNAGSIAIHALRVDFIDRLTSSGNLALPWHRAEKKVPYVDNHGNPVKPETPNAVKLEQFVFDAIPLAANAIVYETDRAEEFSPVKNADGADSPATSRRDQSRRHARWLKSAGVVVPMSGEDPAVKVEISPLFAVSEAALVARKPHIKVDGDLYLE